MKNKSLFFFFFFWKKIGRYIYNVTMLRCLGRYIMGNDCTINGVGTISTGEYRRIKIDGSGIYRKDYNR